MKNQGKKQTTKSEMRSDQLFNLKFSWERQRRYKVPFYCDVRKLKCDTI